MGGFRPGAPFLAFFARSGIFRRHPPTLSQRTAEIFSFHRRKPGTDGPRFTPQCEVMSVTDEHWLGWVQ